MTFRVTRLDDPQGALLQVDGWLEAEGLGDLAREIEGVNGRGPARLILDLSGVRLADEAAVALLRTLAAGGARLINCPPYLALRIAAPGDRNGHEAP